MKRIVNLTTLILCLIFSASILSFAQGLEDALENFPRALAENTGDARATALGHNGIIGASGPNALFLNPALLALLDGKKGSISARGLMGSNEFEFADAEGLSIDDKFTFHPKLTHIVGAAPIKINAENVTMIGAIGFQTVYDAGYNEEWEVDMEDESVTTEVTSKGGYATLTPGIGIQLNQKWNLGFALNLSMMSKTSGTIEQKQTDNGNTEKITVESENELSGSYVLLGASAEISKDLTLGITYRGSLNIKEDWEAKEDDSTIKGKGKLETPSIIGLAVSYRLAPTTIVFGEYQGRPFSEWKYDNEDVEINNGKALKLGVEYTGSNLPLRAGFYSESLPITDQVADAEDPLAITGFTLGTGFTSGKSNVDVYFDYSSLTIDLDDGDEQKQTMYKLGLSFTTGF